MKKSTNFRTLSTALLVLFFTATSFASTPTPYEGEDPIEVDDAASGITVEETVDQIISAQSAALESSSGEPSSASVESLLSPNPKPKDWAPWHLEYMITDLSVTIGGWIGVLINKGTPSVSLFWRRQNRPAPAPTANSFASRDELSDLSISSDATPAEIEMQLEPAIRAALATHVIRNESRFRENVLKAAVDFRNATAALETLDRGAWWASRFRADITIDASGNITPAVGVGADIRLRFEWHRLMKKTVTPSVLAVKTPQLSSNSFFATPRFQTSLAEFAASVSEDLGESFDAGLEKHGYKASSYRVGLGVSAKGDVGIAQASTTLFAHLYFSRDVKKPVVNPRPRFSGTRVEKDLTLFSPSEQKQIQRNHFRRGIRKALRIGQFFAKRASKAHLGKWKIYELKTGFDISTKGTTGTVKVNGLAATEFSFYNLNF